jgi:hypothetical protein
MASSTDNTGDAVVDGSIDDIIGATAGVSGSIDDGCASRGVAIKVVPKRMIALGGSSDDACGAAAGVSGSSDDGCTSGGIMAKVTPKKMIVLGVVLTIPLLVFLRRNNRRKRLEVLQKKLIDANDYLNSCECRVEECKNGIADAAELLRESAASMNSAASAVSRTRSEIWSLTGTWARDLRYGH